MIPRTPALLFASPIAALLLISVAVAAQTARGPNSDWERTLESAKREGKVVVSVPTSAELRKLFETGFQRRFPGIELELSVARGSSNINKIVEEQNAGMKNIDVHIGGTTSIISGLLGQNLLEPIAQSMLLPEVKNASQWWGGHLWVDNEKKYVYSFAAYITETLWYNSNLVKPEEIASYDSLLEPKWSVDIIILLASGMHRHARLVDNIPGLSKKVLTATLRKLERNGIVSRHVYAEIPVRVEYTLTPLGWQLTEPLMALYEWAVAHESELAASHQGADQVQTIGRPALTLAPAPAA